MLAMMMTGPMMALSKTLISTMQAMKASKTTVLAITIVGLMVSACQTRPPTGGERPEQVWQILERTGYASATPAIGKGAFSVRPGQMIANGHVLVTGENAFMIIASDGIQLTLGENTTVTLPEPGHPPVLKVDHGQLRARLATPADRMVHIKTCLLYTSPSPRDKRQSRMPSSA